MNLPSRDGTAINRPPASREFPGDRVSSRLRPCTLRGASACRTQARALVMRFSPPRTVLPYPVDSFPCRRGVERVAGYCASGRGTVQAGGALCKPAGRIRAVRCTSRTGRVPVMRFFPPAVAASLLAAALCGHGGPLLPAPCPLVSLARCSCHHEICTDRPAAAAYIGTAGPDDCGRRISASAFFDRFSRRQPLMFPAPFTEGSERLPLHAFESLPFEFRGVAPVLLAEAVRIHNDVLALFPCFCNSLAPSVKCVSHKLLLHKLQ